jgi:hypothetical protein
VGGAFEKRGKISLIKTIISDKIRIIRYIVKPLRKELKP